MKHNFEKFLKYNKSLVYTLVGASIVTLIIVISIIIAQMSERSALYMEGMVKSTPLIKNDLVSELGTMYIQMELEFEHEINNLITGHAGRKNKRGDTIFYGVNGKNNVFTVCSDVDSLDRTNAYEQYSDSMINNDYVNGVNIKYSNSDITKPDGSSNFDDMLAVISSIYGEDCDKYKEDVKDTFKKLFYISHSYKAEETELYKCTHGCATVFYYCGDSMYNGTYGGETVGHFNTDLKYAPFKIKSHNLYNDIQEYYDKLTNGKNYEINVSFEIENYDGICEVDSGGKTTFTKTTKSFAGCRAPGTTCYHGSVDTLSHKQKIEPKCQHTMSSYRNCTNNTIHQLCDQHTIMKSFPDGSKEKVTYSCYNNPDDKIHDPNFQGCKGHWDCNGHEHWNCHGHVLICCFGHTTLNLDITTLFYEAMIEELAKIRK